MSFNVNIGEVHFAGCFDGLFSSLKKSFKKKKPKDLQISFVNEMNINFPLDMSLSSYFIVNIEKEKMGMSFIVVSGSGIDELNLTGKEMENQPLAEILPIEMYTFFSQLITECIETKADLKTRLNINGTVFEVIIVPVLSNINDVYGCFLMRVPYSKVELNMRNAKKKTSNNEHIIKYVIDREYIIRELDIEPWDRFILENPGPVDESIKSYSIINQNLLTSISSSKVKAIYKKMIDIVFEKRSNKAIHFCWFCDSPNVERKLEMQLKRIGNTRLQIKSTVIQEIINYYTSNYLEFEATNVVGEGLLVCSFCKRIQVKMKQQDLQILNIENSIEPPKVKALQEVIGKNAKMGYTLEQIDSITLGWLVIKQWSQYNRNNKQNESLKITHDLCCVCETELESFLESIEI